MLINSPDLNSVDYRIWGVMQDRVYQTPVRDVTDLRQHLIDTWNDHCKALWTMLSMNGARDFRPACMNEKGQFEHLL